MKSKRLYNNLTTNPEGISVGRSASSVSGTSFASLESDGKLLDINSKIEQIIWESPTFPYFLWMKFPQVKFLQRKENYPPLRKFKNALSKHIFPVKIILAI